MRQLFYSSGYVFVADTTARALLRYARALADTGKADIVRVPIIVGGDIAHAHLLLGPSSQIFDVPATGRTDEPDDPEALAEIARKTLDLQPSTPAREQGASDISDANSWEYGESTALPTDQQ
jgi:hypothetical protein